MTFSPSRDDLAKMFPRPLSGAKRKVWDDYADAITSHEGVLLLEQFEITTPLRWAHLLATWAVETGGLTVFRESGAYTASGILRVFGAGKHSAAVSNDEARKLAGNGEALFERVYGLGNPRKAKALGNTEPGDGWRFRGMGPAQLTGRWSHTEYAAAIGCSLDELCLPVNALHAALLEWKEKNCNTYADRDDVVSIRKLINGGSLKVSASRLNGLDQARAALAKAKKVWPLLLPDVDLTPVADDEAEVSEAKPELSPPVTVKDLTATSRKVCWLVRVRKYAAILGITGGGAEVADESLSLAGLSEHASQIHTLAEFFKDNAFIIMLGGCVIGFFAAQAMINWSIEDHKDGRYVPSKE